MLKKFLCEFVKYLSCPLFHIFPIIIQYIQHREKIVSIIILTNWDISIYIWNRKTEHFNGMLSFNASSKINYGLVIVKFSHTVLLEYFYCKGRVGAWITAGACFLKLKEPLEHWKLHDIISLKGWCSLSGFCGCLKYVAS